MRNNCNIEFDGICIYIESKVKSALIGRIILIILNLIAWPGYFFTALIIPYKEVTNFIFPLIIFLLFLIFILGRFSAWNFWGKENIRINTKSISYSRNYGFIETKEKIISISRLGYSYEHRRTLENRKYGRIYFFDYDDNNNPKNIFQTSILIEKDKADEITEKIELLFKTEFFEKENIIPFTLN